MKRIIKTAVAVAGLALAAASFASAAQAEARYSAVRSLPGGSDPIQGLGGVNGLSAGAKLGGVLDTEVSAPRATSGRSAGEGAALRAIPERSAAAEGAGELSPYLGGRLMSPPPSKRTGRHADGPRGGRLDGLRGGPMNGPMNGPKGGPMNAPKGGPMNGPKGGPMNGPKSGPMNGPKSGPKSGPMDGPKGGPMDGRADGPRGGPMDGAGWRADGRRDGRRDRRWGWGSEAHAHASTRTGGHAEAHAGDQAEARAGDQADGRPGGRTDRFESRLKHQLENRFEDRLNDRRTDRPTGERARMGGVPGAARLAEPVASTDEIAPLVEDASHAVSTYGTKAAGSFGDTVTPLAGTAKATTDAVSGFSRTADRGVMAI
ncbi:hypothetical protein AB0H88_51530 [Nonomuraea sp. NPDC050680]|uniref:hypothetical protein n=1 Tax=Nonomuraea sp. NPDC050680 TaxID=3154630 RepID=UPI00340EB675